MPTFKMWKPVAVVVVLLVSLFLVYPSLKWYSYSPEDRIDRRSTAEMREIEVQIEQFKQEGRNDEIPALLNEYESLKEQFESYQKRAIPLGLDLQGGIHAVLEVDIESITGEMAQVDTVKRSREIIGNRIDQLGVLEPSIQRQGKNRIIVEIPGITDPTRIIDLLGQTARLEFVLIKDIAEVQPVLLRIDEKLGIGIMDKIDKNDSGSELEVLEKDQKYLDQVLSRTEAQKALPVGHRFLWSRPEVSERKGTVYRLYLAENRAAVTGEMIKDARMQFDQAQFNRPYVTLELDKKGAAEFRRLTGDNIGKRLAIVLDNRVYSAPVIEERIPYGNASISGRFTQEEAADLAVVLRAGALPADIEIVETRAVGPSLGMDSIRKSVTAGTFGIIIVAAFMIVYYLLCGAIADFALFLNLVVLLGAMALFKTTLTLPGIAGMILIIGMAVDANVLIYERIREELRIRRDKALAISIEKGYSRAFLTILDANLTTLLTAMVLFVFGTGPIRGFAVTLSIGIIISMFTAIFVTRIIFDFMTEKMNVKRLRIGVFSLPQQMKIDFMKMKNIAMGFSALLIIAGIVWTIYQGGLKTNIDFAGGYLLQLKFGQPVATSDLRTVLSDGGYEAADLQQIVGEENEFMIKIKEDARSTEGKQAVRELFERQIRTGLTDTTASVELTQGIETMDLTKVGLPRDEYTVSFEDTVTDLDVSEALQGSLFAGSDVVPVAEQDNVYTVKISQEPTTQILALLRNGDLQENDFELRRQEKVGARVGDELKSKAINAAIFAIIGILLYVGWRFQFGFAIGAVAALIHDVLITLAIFSLMGREVSLSVVAAILTLIGYSLNDTIVVYDRIRENRGLLGGPRDWPTIINNSINQTLGRTMLTSLTTLFVIVCLFLAGGVVINDFAFVLMVGVIVGTYSSAFIASPILLFWQGQGQRKRK